MALALIPFSMQPGSDYGEDLARGLTLELSDYLRSCGADPTMLTSAQTEEDGAWRKLVSFAEELTTEAVIEFIEGVRPENLDESEQFAHVISGMVEPLASDPFNGFALKILVTDITGGFSRGSFSAELKPGDFARPMSELMNNVADAVELKSPAAFDPGTQQFSAWLNLLITRALTLAAEVGAMPRDANGVFDPALEALRLDPGYTIARDRLCDLAQVLVLERGFKPEDAAKAISKAESSAGPDWKTLRARGHLMLAGEKYGPAAKAFCQVLSGKHEAPEKDERMLAALMAGRAFNMAERHPEAQRVLSVAMQAENLRVEAIVESATSSAAMGENVVAERLWNRAIELEPQSINARLHLARYYRSRGEPDKAADQYESLLGSPGLPREIFADAAEFFVLNQMHAKALKAAENYADEHPGDAIAHVLMASSLNATGKHKRALKALEKAEICVGVDELADLVIRQRRFAEYPEAEADFRRLADMAITGRPVDAETELRRLLKRFENFWEAYLFLGIALRRQEKWEEARDVLEKLREHQELAAADKELTGIYSKLDQPEQALECAKRAMEATPEDPTLMTNYAAALLENDEVDLADKYARRALLVIPDDHATQKLIELIKQRMVKRGVIANFKAVLRDAKSWLNVRKKKGE